MHGCRDVVCALAVGLMLAACGSSHPQPGAPDHPAPKRPAISLVTSFVVIEACPGAKRLNTRQATKEIEELLGPCTKVPGGSAHFSATLLPNGSVELASPSGDPDEGVIPTCLVKHQSQLRHKIKLARPCRFDVKLDEQKQ